MENVNKAIRECIAQQRPLTFLDTLDAESQRFSYRFRVFMMSLYKCTGG